VQSGQAVTYRRCYGAHNSEVSQRARSNILTMQAQSAAREGDFSAMRLAAEKAVALDPAKRANWVGKSLGAEPPSWARNHTPGASVPHGVYTPLPVRYTQYMYDESYREEGVCRCSLRCQRPAPNRW
jgi:hypothetical protein